MRQAASESMESIEWASGGHTTEAAVAWPGCDVCDEARSAQARLASHGEPCVGVEAADDEYDEARECAANGG